jgi:hypothetical protein
MQLINTLVLKNVSLPHKTPFKGIQGRSFPLPPLQTVVNHALFYICSILPPSLKNAVDRKAKFKVVLMSSTHHQLNS